jgi:hypothetical protein
MLKGKTLLPVTSEYRGNDFLVRLRPTGREAVVIDYIREGSHIVLDGERIGNRWEGIKAVIPRNLEDEKIAPLVAHLEAAFLGLGIDYMIVRLVQAQSAPEVDRQSAITELRTMGFDVGISSNGAQASLKVISDVRHRDRDTLRNQIPRMMFLIHEARGTRQQFQVLAQSKEF